MPDVFTSEAEALAWLRESVCRRADEAQRRSARVRAVSPGGFDKPTA
jgi:hypothetical protein